MGMSASQVRFLSLQHRKHDIGRELSTLSNRKMSLSRDMNRVARNYTNALNQNVLKWSNDSGATYNNLSYGLMMKPNDINTESPCIVSTRGGAVVVDNLNNLTGKIVDSNGDSLYLEFDGTNGTSGTIQNEAYYRAVYGDSWDGSKNDVISYANIAKWITSTPVEDGSKEGKVGVVSSDGGVISGTSNVGSYTIPENTMNYGYQDGLRYQIFQELGLVSENTSVAFSGLLNKVYGDETAYEFGDYTKLLQGFVNAAEGQNSSHSRERLATDVYLIDPSKVTGGISLAGENFDVYNKYFGKIQNDKWVGGSLMGNLVLAQYALTEYDNWCNSLHYFNVNSGDTTLTFTSTSGRSVDHVVPSILMMNSNVDAGNTSTAAYFGHSGVRPIAAGDRTSNNSDINTFGGVWNEGLWVDASGSPGGDILAFMETFHNAFTEAGDDINTTTGATWQSSANIPEMTTYRDDSGNLVETDVCTAARIFAMKRTTEFFNSLVANRVVQQVNRTCNHSGGGTASKAAEVADQNAGIRDNYDGLVSSVRSFHWYQKLGRFFASLGTAIAGVVTAAVGGQWAWGGFNLFSTSGDLMTDVFHDGNTGYAFNLANVEKVYLSYYEIYMRAHRNGINLFEDPGAVSSNSATTYVNDNSFIDTNAKALGLPYESSAGVYNANGTTRDTSRDWQILSNYDTFYNADGEVTGYAWKYSVTDPVTGATTIYYPTDTNPHNTNKNSAIVNSLDTQRYKSGKSFYEFEASGTENGTTYTENKISYAKYNFANGYYIQTCNETAKTTTNEYYFNSDQTYGGKTFRYVKEVIDQNGNATYTYKNAAGNDVGKPQRAQTIQTDSYEGITIKQGSGSTYASTVSLYVTKNEVFEQKLIKDVKDAEQAIEDAKEEAERFYSAKEMKLMDYYDAIFSRISQCGWVQDNNVSNKDYLNAKLENNNFFVTTCRDKVNQNGFTYTTKLAQTVTKIYQIHDSNAENQALSEYEEAKSLIQSKEKKVDARMQKLETEQEVINTELESLKKVRDDNISKTFKIFA